MNKKTIGIIIGAISLTIIYFSYNIILGFDSSQYIWLAEMFTPNLDFCNWAPVRSFVFPLGIFILNMIFGKNATGLLIGTYIFYLTMLVAAFFMYKNTIQQTEKSNIIKTIYIICFFFFVALNPIIFGFYHVLLTEFASVTIAIVMSYLSWSWTKFDFKENKVKYIIYTTVFSILVVCSWHLKQTYILTSIIPLIISILISIIENFKKENIIQRLITFGICIISLIISIIGWNYILKVKNVKLDTSTSSEGLLGRTIMEGISEYRAVPNKEEYKKENIELSNRITSEDKEKILSILNETSNEYKGFIMLDKGTYMNPTGNRKVIYTKEKDISIGEGLRFVINTLLQEPQTILSSYFSNYLGICDIYDVKVTTEYGNYYYIDKKYNPEKITEINFLGYCIYRNSINALDLPDYYIEYAREYINNNNRMIKPINDYMVGMTAPAKNLYRIVMLLLPFLWLIKIIISFITRKNHNKEYRKTNHLIIILYTYAFGQMMMYTVLGALMDRYALAPFTATLIAMILDIYTITRGRKDKNEKNNRNNKETRK